MAIAGVLDNLMLPIDRFEMADADPSEEASDVTALSVPATCAGLLSGLRGALVLSAVPATLRCEGPMKNRSGLRGALVPRGLRGALVP